MKNLMKVVGIIAMAAVIGLVFSCDQEVDPDDQVVITINEIPAEYDGRHAMVALLEDNTNSDAITALSYSKTIRNGQVTGLEMMDTDGKAFGKEATYYVCLMITTQKNGEGIKLYVGITGSKKKVVKGNITYGAVKDTFREDIEENVPPIPALSFLGTYTASSGTNITETILFSDEKSFRISDNSKTAGQDQDFLTFTIDEWAKASVPSTYTATYKTGYKFSGKITGGSGYIPSDNTAPGFQTSDVNSTKCHMYIYCTGTAAAGNYTFIRTAFSKETGTDSTTAISTSSQIRVYTKQ
jgi:hypothetical protein